MSVQHGLVDLQMLRGETIVDSRLGRWDSVHPVFWECGSHELSGEEALTVKGHLLLKTDGGEGTQSAYAGI